MFFLKVLELPLEFFLLFFFFFGGAAPVVNYLDAYQCHTVPIRTLLRLISHSSSFFGAFSEIFTMVQMGVFWEGGARTSKKLGRAYILDIHVPYFDTSFTVQSHTLP